MRLLFLADFRSPTAKQWIGHLAQRGHEVSVVSSYPCDPQAVPGVRVHQAPLAFAGAALRSPVVESAPHLGGPSVRDALIGRVRRHAQGELGMAAYLRVRHAVCPFEVSRHRDRVRSLIEEAEPDLVHALRIPYEGIAAAQATPHRYPLVVSIWGNDLVLIAGLNPFIGRRSRQALERTDGLLADTHRDIRLAREWGYAADKPTGVLPGGGGVRLDRFRPGPPPPDLRARWHIPDDAVVCLNPRGVRASMRLDVFFQAVRRVVTEQPRAIFLWSAMQAHPAATAMVAQLGLGPHVRLLPLVPHDEMPDLFRLAEIVVSPSVHDGTPNSLLEAMASGCLPVAGAAESIREWVSDGVNGLLCDATDVASLTAALLRALDDRELRRVAAERNLRIIQERAEYDSVADQAERLYATIIQSHRAARA